MFQFKNPQKVLFGLTITAGTITSLSMYFRWRLEERLGNQTLCKNCIQDMLLHSPSMQILGEPVTWRRPNLMNTYNRITENKANIALPVTGSKTAGDLLIDACKEEAEPKWILKSLKLKVDDTETSIK